MYKISLDFGVMLYLLFCFYHYIIKYCKTYCTVYLAGAFMPLYMECKYIYMYMLLSSPQCP